MAPRTAKLADMGYATTGSIPMPQNPEWIPTDYENQEAKTLLVYRADELEFQRSEQGKSEEYVAPMYIAMPKPIPEPAKRSLVSVEADVSKDSPAYAPRPSPKDKTQQSRDNAIVIPDDEEVTPQLSPPSQQQNVLSVTRPDPSPRPCTTVPVTPPRKRKAETAIIDTPQKIMRSTTTPPTPSPTPSGRNMIQPSQSLQEYFPELATPPMPSQQSRQPLSGLVYHIGNQPSAVRGNSRPVPKSGTQAQRRDQQSLVASPVPPQQQQRPLAHLEHNLAHWPISVESNSSPFPDSRLQSHYGQQSPYGQQPLYGQQSQHGQQQHIVTYPPPQEQQQGLPYPGSIPANGAEHVYVNSHLDRESQLRALHTHQQAIVTCRRTHASQMTSFHDVERQRFTSWQQAWQSVQQNPALLQHSRLPTYEEIKMQFDARKARLLAQQQAELRALGVGA